MSNFVLATTQGRRQLVSSPADWWRSVGDTNLRNIRCMNIFVPSQSMYHTPGVMVKYGKPPRAPQSVHITIPHPQAQHNGDSTSRVWAIVPKGSDESLANSYGRKLGRQGRVEERLQQHVDVLETEALHVRVLECILAELEPLDVDYLRDENALDGPTGTGNYISPEGNEVREIEQVEEVEEVDE